MGIVQSHVEKERGRPTSRFEPYKMAWVMIDLISVARPVLISMTSEYILPV